jgi:hypothetical protein
MVAQYVLSENREGWQLVYRKWYKIPIVSSMALQRSKAPAHHSQYSD